MFRIQAEAQELERSGRSVLHLEIGDTSGFTNPELIRLLTQECGATASLGYSPSAGESVLRDALARQYSQECRTTFTRENVVVTPANAAISQLLGVLCDEGDRVLLPDPGFPTYQLAARFNGLEPIFFSLMENVGFQPELAEIGARMAADTRVRALVIDNPSNPLGLYHDVGIMNHLAELCARHGVPLILDDTYKNLIYTAAPRRILHKPTNFYVYTLSKDAAAPALRIGCVVGDPAVVVKIADYNSLFYSCLPKPMQLAAAAYLNGGHLRVDVLRSAMAERIEKASTILEESPWLSFVKPNSAIYIYINISRTGLHGDILAGRLLRERGVCVCPGTGFGPSGLHYIRICLSGDEVSLYKGCTELVDFVASLVTESTAACSVPGGPATS